MNAFYAYHKDSIRFGYRCFDRILLNGLIQPFSAARARGRLLLQLPADLSGQPRCAAWVRPSNSTVGSESTPINGTLQSSRRQKAGATNLSSPTPAAPSRIRSSSSSKLESRRLRDVASDAMAAPGTLRF